MSALRVFAEFQLTGDKAVSFDNLEINSKAFLRQHILQHSADFGGEGEWAFLLNVEGLGKRDGKSARYEYTSSHPARSEWGTTATARVTGIPASIGAQKLARGLVARVGVVARCQSIDGIKSYRLGRAIRVEHLQVRMYLEEQVELVRVQSLFVWID